MATPLPQADNGLPGRTAIQSPLANSPIAGGEKKSLAGEIEARKPVPPDKPAPRPAPVSAPAVAKNDRGAKDDPEAVPETPSATDWGLAPKKRPLLTKLRALVALGTLASSVAGYFGYDRYFSNGAGDDAQIAGAGGAADSTAPGQSESARDGQDGDPFETLSNSEIDQDPQSPANSEPRKMRHVPNAAPIAAKHGAGSRSPKKPSRNSLSIDDESLDGDDETDDSELPRMSQAEPDLDGDELTGPSLGASSGASRRNAAHGNGANRARDSAGGPRITSNQRRDEDLADDLSDDKFDGYRSAQPKHGTTTHGSAGGRRISVVDVHDETETDERFDDYTPQNPGTRRAVSKTKVIRPTDGTAQLPPSAGIGGTGNRRGAASRGSLADDDFEDEAPEAPQIGRGRNDFSIDEDSDFNRPSRDGMTPIRPRGSPRVAAAGREFSARRHAADEFSDNQEPASDIYRILPDDNFWKISRKQYGSARYFQALTRHNQDRVPDPQKLKPGTQISTPSAAYLEKRYPDLIEKAPPVSMASGLSEHKGARPRFEKPVSAGAFDDVPERKSDSESAAGYFYSKSGAPMYRVGSDDTLTGIAQRHLGRASRWKEIYDQNQDVLKSPNDLTLGTVIRLPEDASRLSLVPEGERRR